MKQKANSKIMSDNNNNNSESAAKKRKTDELEPSPRGKKLAHDLLTSLDDPDLCDVTLVGSDGGRVPAVRAYLSARSDVLKHLLVGRFKEASEEEVRMDYPSAVIRALVHFCCTDKVPKLLELGSDDDPAESLRLSAKLVTAADYYGLDSLKEKTNQRIKEFTKANKSLKGLNTCVLLQEASASPSLMKYYGSVLYTIQRNPDLLLAKGGSQPAGVTFLSSENLFKIVDDNLLRACAWILFQAIKAWVDKGTYEEEMSPEDRREFAKKCCARLDFRMISPPDLLGPVSESGLVDQPIILQTLQKQWKGNVIGIYGAANQDVNGVYEEVPINDSFEPVADTDQGQGYKKRFDKRVQQDGNEPFMYTIICEWLSDCLYWMIVEPPKGASCILTSADLQKIIDDNVILYTGTFDLDEEDDPETLRDGSEITWECMEDSETRRPTMIFGQQLSSKLPTNFDN